MPFDRRSVLRFVYLACAAVGFCGLAILAFGNPFTRTSANKSKRPPVLYLATRDANDARLVAISEETTCDEPNLVIITHGWVEAEPWPAQMALAIRQRVSSENWRCGWYDWRQQAKRFFPSDAARVARDSAGPLLGEKILQLSRKWRHVHLIGHSAGSWIINEAARVIARETPADLHLTFLDAYVPDGWDEKSLGNIGIDPNATLWVEHYFTRDAVLDLTENVLTGAHNVDVTEVNPGFNGHKFPWHWYHATVVGRFTTRPRFADAKVSTEAENIEYGFARALEAGTSNWGTSVTLRPTVPPVKLSGR